MNASTSDRQIQALHAAISRRSWHDVEVAANAIRDAAPVSREDVFRRLIQTATLLYQNAEGCAVNHHGHDFATQGTPGWLVDAKADIDAARHSLLSEGEGNG